MADPSSKRRPRLASVWAEARGLLWRHRGPLAIGLALMVVNRLAQLVLPASTKFVVDDVLTGGRTELLLPIAVAAGVATLIQAGTGFALSQVVSPDLNVRNMEDPFEYNRGVKRGALVEASV
jgi:ABC-type bacteriocin/lantibiotic exporter with double-glycine peptidase domain